MLDFAGIYGQNQRVSTKAVNLGLGTANGVCVGLKSTTEIRREEFNCRLESPGIWMRTLYSVGYDIGVSATR